MIGEILVAGFLVVSGSFVLVGSYGLLKLDNPMSRLHAPTKISTLGVGGVLAASMIQSFLEGRGSLHELLIMAFLFGSAPLSAHFLAKLHLHQTVTETDLPRPVGRAGWAVFLRPEWRRPPPDAAAPAGDSPRDPALPPRR